MRRGPRSVLLALVAGLLVTGCASTRVGSMGVLPNHDTLVTLVVTKDKTIIQDQCRAGAHAGRPILGCQTTKSSVLPDGREVRIVTIVRYTDSLPSEMAFEIDLHELCHAIATVQRVTDPCHVGNDGYLNARH